MHPREGEGETMLAFLEEYFSWVAEVNKRHSLSTYKCETKINLLVEILCSPSYCLLQGTLM